MTHRTGRLTALILAAVMLLSACGAASKEEEKATSRTARETSEARTQASKENASSEEGIETEPETETELSRPDIISWQPLWQQHLARVIKEKQETLGRTSFVLDNISRVSGMGILHAKDLDGDKKEELIFVWPELKEGGYYDYRMEIWAASMLSAECVYSGICCRMGADNRGMTFWEDEKGEICFLYDDEESMNGRYLGRIRNGQFEEAATLDWSQITYDRETDLYTYEGKSYRPLETLTTYCYNWGEENDDYLQWKKVIKDSYTDALTAVGLAKEDGVKVYTPGLTSLLDDEYLRIRVTHVDASGEVSAVWEYDYDDAGHEIRSYRNDIMRTENTYNDQGILVHEVSYTTEGIKSEESIYDDAGNLLEKITYSDGRVNWHFEYTYDEKGRMATESSAIGGLKEYFYNDDNVMIEARTVDPSTGRVENTHTFELDEEGRPVSEYLNKDGMRLLYKTWDYDADGSRTETGWKYEAYDANADRYYLEGREKPGLVTDYDAAGNVIRQRIYAFADYGSEEIVLNQEDEYSWDPKGNELTHSQKLYNKDVLSYEESTSSEYTEDGLLKERLIYYHCYGYWSNLGETEREVWFNNYEADFNELGYRVHVVTWKNDDPYGKGEEYQNDEMFILYENAYGDLMGLD